MTKTSATTQSTWFAKASFVKQKNQNLGSKLGKKKKKKTRTNTGSDMPKLEFLKY